MKWLIILALLLVAAITLAIFLNREAEARKQARVVAENEAVLLRYERILKSGTTREDVEDYLRAHNTSFFERCCYEDRTTATVIKIADGAPPWYCSELRVYVVFEFVPEPIQDPLHPFGADVLKRVHLESSGEGCL